MMRKVRTELAYRGVQLLKVDFPSLHLKHFRNGSSDTTLQVQVDNNRVPVIEKGEDLNREIDRELTIQSSFCEYIAGSFEARICTFASPSRRSSLAFLDHFSRILSRINIRPNHTR